MDNLIYPNTPILFFLKNNNEERISKSKKRIISYFLIKSKIEEYTIFF